MRVSVSVRVSDSDRMSVIQRTKSVGKGQALKVTNIRFSNKIFK